MNAEDAIIAKKRNMAERMEADHPHHSEQGPHPKKGRIEDKTGTRRLALQHEINSIRH